MWYYKINIAVVGSVHAQSLGTVSTEAMRATGIARLHRYCNLRERGDMLASMVILRGSSAILNIQYTWNKSLVILCFLHRGLDLAQVRNKWSG